MNDNGHIGEGNGKRHKTMMTTKKQKERRKKAKKEEKKIRTQYGDELRYGLVVTTEFVL